MELLGAWALIETGACVLLVAAVLNRLSDPDNKPHQLIHVLAVRCELVGSGRTLAHHVVAARDGEEAHEPRKVLLAILPALRALAVLHDRKVVHGDVKPGNLVLDGAGLCHLSDLGLAQPLHEASRRLHGHALGTPAYLAPELQSNEGKIRKFTIRSTPLKKSIFPKAHTCFNRMHLPLYKSKHDLHTYISKAIQMELTGFGNE